MAELRKDVIDHIVDWAEVHRDAKELVRKLVGSGEWNGIIAVTRGGLVPAAIIAREMGIRHIDTLWIATYDEQYIGDVNVITKPADAVRDKGKGWLRSDDLVDTGMTMKTAREFLPNCHVATVYAKPEGLKFVDTYVHQVPQNHWVFFPWDTEPKYVAPIVYPENNS